MVLFHIKRTDTDQFLFETKTTESNDTLIRTLVKINNMRVLIQQLCLGCERLVEFGPMKRPEEQGLDEVKEKAGEAIEKGPHYKADPLGQRTGNACAPELAEIVKRTCEEAKACIHKDQVARRVALSVEMLQERIDNIHGAVKIAYPMGLPEWDVVRQMLEDKADFDGTSAGQEMLDADTAQLWWAGKEFFRDQTVGDRAGRNEKTRLMARLQRRGGGPPVREPAVSEEERKSMMAHYFKKQEEAKRMAEDEEDDFLYSAWANPKGLKSALVGTSSGIAFRPGGRKS
mmetsp:Transcript_10750/g.34172  ORF Transcript_10750/g.34172 Transcript_10750/m.34172 type:complete len:287 (+) Transcript_10750:28-888(+)